ncbi:transcriptional repressor ILP1 isoform X2 [Vigna angularis]|uniref:transcriptional repressor ILP1 isoform X2 n=1 Tax=Phaseolus angularis TaxID=3914 RepID=UPI0022B50A9F|nr:transcriptional repressor ILP1 isoform X2 [Vigna angularis]
MSTAKSRNFRRRGGGDTEANDEDGDTSTLSSRPPSSAKPKKPQVPKLLSFADDEDNENPRPRSAKPQRSTKPSSAHKITTHKDRIASSSPSVPSNVQPQAGTYTKETLRELQKNTRTLVTSSSSSRPEPKPPAEPVIVIKGLVKPVASEPQGRESDSEGDHKEVEGKLGGLGLHNGKDSFFPDEEMIKAIRAKRERLRQARPAAPDYISLDGGSNHGAAEGLSDEEPEFRGRIAILGDKVEGGKKGVFEEVEERRVGVRFKEEEEDDEEEEKMWEEEQFRKGLGKRMDEGSARVDVPVGQSAQQHKYVVPSAATVYGSVPNAAALVSPGIGGAIESMPALDVLSISQQAESARKALVENVRKLKDSHGRTMSSLSKTDENLSASLLNITALENSLVVADEKYRFMQKLRSYVTNICDFLQHKAFYIEELEEQMKKLHEDRASTIFERRTANNDDEIMEVEAAVKAAMSVFNKKGNIEAAKFAAQEAYTALRKQKDLPVKLDEFGRDLNLEKRMQMKIRAEASQRKRSQVFDSNKLTPMELDSHKIEGESSTDESDSESQAYESQRDLVLQAADEIFGDASEEYGQLSLVKERMEEWKREYSSSYKDAYMSLSLPLVFSPYVRLELLRWDPLHKGIDFSEMKWYKLLLNYGLPEDRKNFVHDDGDADLELVPNLVEKVALPLLHYEISHCWDMLSHQETKNAIAATKLIVDHVSHESEALTGLLVSIRTRLADAVANLTVPTWSPLVLVAVPDAARVAAYRKCSRCDNKNGTGYCFPLWGLDWPKCHRRQKTQIAAPADLCAVTWKDSGEKKCTRE